MAQFHFVEDYEKLVADLVAAHPIDEAMAIAVGGKYDLIGKIELDALNAAGFTGGMSLFDLGCGSGRLAAAIAGAGINISYMGTDVVQALLDYAKTKTPKHFKYICHRSLSVPAENSTFDIACAFSVFTHLLHHESFVYMQDIRRTLKPDGKLVFSFLEFGSKGQWGVFEDTINLQRNRTTPHLNTFIERNAIEVWAMHAGFKVEKFIDGYEPIGNNPVLGQSIAILRRVS